MSIFGLQKDIDTPHPPGLSLVLRRECQASQGTEQVGSCSVGLMVSRGTNLRWAVGWVLREEDVVFQGDDRVHVQLKNPWRPF